MSAVNFRIDALADARRQMTICNACRYCEGYCAVFPAMELRRTFPDGDLVYLANLCFDCRACQYAPAHPFDVNVPRVLHLGVVAGLFFTAPYGKFTHVVYRYAALVGNAIERRQA